MYVCAQILPTCDEYHYKIIERETASTKDHFTASFTVNVNDREEFDEWKKKFEKKTTTQYTIRDTKPCKGEQVTQLNFKQYLKCVHNVKRGKLGLRKHTACPAEMTVTISNDSKCSNSSRCRVDLSWVHNHTILAADVIRRHRVSSATDAKLIDLFTHGHSPSTALQYIRTEIEESLQDGERLEVALANRSICPDNYHCQYVFRKLFSKEYGEPNDNTHLDTFIKKINAEQGIECVAREEYSGKNLVAICTPFMRRVHENIEEAAELMFVDSTGGLDRDGFRVFILLTHSKAGGWRMRSVCL